MNSKKLKDDIVSFIRDYYTTNNVKGAVLGVSGGKDSAVALALMVEAIGKENVVGVSMPCHSVVEDKSLADRLCEYYGVEIYNVDLTEPFDSIESAVKCGFGDNNSYIKDSSINLKPRLRMSTLYYVAAMLSKKRGGLYLVVGTSNKCELYVGYFTKGGDSVYDIAPLCDLTVEEVIAVGEELGVPGEVLYRVPSDGLSGMSDEEKLGVKYSDIAKVINGEEVDIDIANKIDRLHRCASHKFVNNYFRKK